MTQRSHAPLFLLALVPWLSGAGCSGPDDPGATPPEALTYHHDVAPVLDRYCVTCHSPGNIGPFTLTDYGSVKLQAARIRAAVESGLMPPWLPSDKGQPMRYSRKMRAQDQKLLLDWIGAGTREGDPGESPRTDIPAAETVEPPRPDLVLAPSHVYQPRTDRSNDDYHCFSFDPQLTTDTYLQAAVVVPDNKAIVHHAIVYAIGPSGAGQVRAMDPAGAGFDCFGGPGVDDSARTLLAWAPGGVATRLPEGYGLKIEKGSMLVLQLHYNLLAYKGVGDQSKVEMEVTTTPPKTEMFLLPVADPRHLHIKAGDPAATQVIDVPVSLLETFFGLPAKEMTIYAVGPHMHLLGRHISVSVDDGTTLIDIPRWDFHWQQGYALQQPMTLGISEGLRVSCQYDNSQANQPVVNGQQQHPRDLGWGEGTLDEMCLNFFLASFN